MQFRFILAGYLKMTVAEMMEKMTHREFRRWIWHYQNHPFGELAQDGRFMDLMIFESNANRKKGKKPKPFVHFIERGKGLAKRTKEAAQSVQAEWDALRERHKAEHQADE